MPGFKQEFKVKSYLLDKVSEETFSETKQEIERWLETLDVASLDFNQTFKINKLKKQLVALTKKYDTPKKKIKAINKIILENGAEIEISEDSDSDEARESIDKKAEDRPFFDMPALSIWCGCEKPFGAYRGHRILANSVVLLSHSEGFAIFFPKAVYESFDLQVPIQRPAIAEPCGIIGADYGYVKLNANNNLNEDEQRFMQSDVEKSLDRIELFYTENFINSIGLCPESAHFSHGAHTSFPNNLPMRIRLAGDYHFNIPISDVPKVTGSPIFTTSDLVGKNLIKIGNKVVPFSVMASSSDFENDKDVKDVSSNRSGI